MLSYHRAPVGRVRGPLHVEAMMKRIGAAKFKEQCLALLDQLAADGLIVTKHGRPVARVLPYDSQGAE